MDESERTFRVGMYCVTVFVCIVTATIGGCVTAPKWFIAEELRKHPERNAMELRCALDAGGYGAEAAMCTAVAMRPRSAP